MRSRLSIFSSRLLGSAFLWTLLAMVLIERYAGGVLPLRHAEHEVDTLLYNLDHGRIDSGDTVFLGDSVGRQIARALLRRQPGAFVPLASNAAIETPGQYYVLQRYLATHPQPQRVIVLMGSPVIGQLQGHYVENYFQRGFLHWREIMEVSWAKCSAQFAVVMAGYKLFPTYRYRRSLQASMLPWKSGAAQRGWFDLSAASSRPKKATRHGLFDIAGFWIASRSAETPLADIYFQRLAALLEARGIPWEFLPIPIPQSAVRRTEADGFFGRQMGRVCEIAQTHPHLKVHREFPLYPDDWFSDGKHFKESRLPAVAEAYSRILAGLESQ